MIPGMRGRTATPAPIYIPVRSREPVRAREPAGGGGGGSCGCKKPRVFEPPRLHAVKDAGPPYTIEQVNELLGKRQHWSKSPHDSLESAEQAARQHVARSRSFAVYNVLDRRGNVVAMFRGSADAPGGAGMRERVVAEVSERARPHRPREIEPVVLAGTRNGTHCRPFLKIEKDAEKFAACNALANEIGPLNTPKKAFRIIEDAIGDEVNEVFGLMTLDLHLRFKGLGETGRGEPTSVMAPIVPTLQAALIDGAHAVVIFHVHPSGIKAKPSQADKDTTKAFVDAFRPSGVILMDHIIVGGDVRKRSYYSFLEAGLIPKN